MREVAAVGLGVVVAVAATTILAGLRRVPERSRMARLATFRAKSMSAGRSEKASRLLIAGALAVLLGAGAWYATRWPVAALIGAAAGITVPEIFAAPRRRRAVADEIEAYSQWTEQLRDLVAASGSLFEAVALSVPSSPPLLRPHVAQMVSLAGTVGLKPALNWFAAHMASPYADRLVLGMVIAWESGAQVTEAFDTTARSMRTEVEMRRRNEVANARVWTQVMSILGITAVSVVGMFVINSGFFEPFASTLGQVVLAAVGLLIFGNVAWVIKLSASGGPVRLLDAGGLTDVVAPGDADRAGAQAAS